MEITDHAVVRYLERVLNIDIQRLKQQIEREVSEKACDAAMTIGGYHKIKRKGFKYVFHNRTLITVIKI